jgi:hypothetical protein
LMSFKRILYFISIKKKRKNYSNVYNGVDVTLDSPVEVENSSLMIVS